MNTKCSIIEDMIPLFKEGLCSEDTAEMVKEHLAECDNCRRLCEDMTNDTKADKAEIPDESKVFRKVNSKMKRSKVKIILLSVILCVILGGLGFLTFGQITRWEGLISFDTLIQSVETYRIAKIISKGDMEAYADSVSSGYNFDANFNVLRNYDEICEINRKALNEAYEKYMKGREVKRVYSFGQYRQEFRTYSKSDSAECSVVNSATIEYKDGTALELEFMKSYDGKYLCTIATNSVDGDTDAFMFGKTIEYVNIPKFFPDGLAEVLFSKYNKEFFEEHPDRKSFLMSSWFISEERDNIDRGMCSYYIDNGFTVDKFISSELRYDKENNMMYHDFFLEGSDEKGKALMNVKIYSTPEGLLPPANEDIQIVANGCSDELIEGLKGFFGSR